MLQAYLITCCKSFQPAQYIGRCVAVRIQKLSAKELIGKAREEK